MKAFLSHSSKDKEFIRQVSSKLGRQNCLFDEQCFETGVEFKRSIEHNLDKSSSFVLFASLSSLDSIWVNFEIDEAWYRILNGKITSSLVYIIDNECQRDKIPEWLNRALIKKETSPTIIANDIQYYLDKFAYELQREHFVGRSRDQEKLEDIVNPFDGTPPPRTIAINGLPGIGRRTLIKRSNSQLFNLNNLSEIRVESGDRINDICAKLADITEAYSSQEELKDIILEISTLSNTEANERVIKNLQHLVESGYLPLFIDEGGLLDVNGILQNCICQIIQNLHDNDTAYISFISNRKISDESIVSIPSIMLKPLSVKDTKKLVAKVATSSQLSLDAGEISEISEYINGYPPAAYFAINQGVEYGKDLLLSDKTKLVNFSTQRFLKHLKGSAITNTEEEILALLATYSPLPLLAIAGYCKCELTDIHDSIYKLIDKALVIVDSNALYRIADPISNAARNLFGFPNNDGLKLISVILKEYAENVDNRKKLDVSRVLFRLGAILKDDDAKNSGIHLKNDFIQLVQTSYHNRSYKEAIEFGFDAIKECPDNGDAREFLIRALIQEERWDAAKLQLEEFKKYTELRDVFFLLGFLYRKKGNTSEAVTNFLESEKVGRRGAAIKRELAHCYLLMNEINDAVKYIKDAIRLQPDNSHVVDMAVKIYMKASMEEQAKKTLDRLELIDNQEYYLLRKSTFEYTFGHFKDSEKTALNAVNEGGRNFFAAKVQLVKSYIKNEKFKLANTSLNDIDKVFSGKRNDVRTALRCSLLIAENRFKDAYKYSERFKDKSCFPCKATKIKSLRGMIGNVSIPYKERQRYKNKLNELATNTSTDIDVLDEIEL